MHFFENETLAIYSYSSRAQCVFTAFGVDLHLRLLLMQNRHPTVSGAGDPASTIPNAVESRHNRKSLKNHAHFSREGPVGFRGYMFFLKLQFVRNDATICICGAFVVKSTSYG